jgi:concanavalin A-like lectin/glucanase superfamily protein/hydrazine synthase alpha subunit-like protein
MLMAQIARPMGSIIAVLFLVAGAWAEDASPEAGELLQPIAIDKPLVAHWTFDEQFGATFGDSSGNARHASPQTGRPLGFSRINGLFGGGLSFSGNHRLSMQGEDKFDKIRKISFSAWTMPRKWGHHNEIFRKEDGTNRVLFSFQEGGTILSLGLNIDGYVECDAKIDPAALLDGGWHHAAATFDGRFMRVYLDGKEIRAMERPGEIAAGGTAPGCIGSCNGRECFQGNIDDLRIFENALTADEITLLYRNGQEAITSLSIAVAADEPALDVPLVAHWTFNERGAVGIVRDVSQSPELTINSTKGLPRSRGVYGSALKLSADSVLKTEIGSRLEDLAEITFSAWTRPTDLGGYRAIFRQECPERLLFAFQANGSILSLGLNVDGYAECDAAVDRSLVLDGAWHHAAATFDGQYMRVYLDGKEIGSRLKPGKISTLATAPAFVGSSSGSGEFFRGGLDDLRIYAAALTAEQVNLLYQGGIESMAAFARELDKQVDTFFVRGDSFAQTLAGSRESLAASGGHLDGDLAGIFLARLRADFAAEYTDFVNWIEASPIEYLTTSGNELNEREAGRLVELMLEYKPITECQWEKQSPGDVASWAEAEAIRGRFEELKSQAAAAQFSPEWIEIILEAGSRIDFRPTVSEGVAPYITPRTPETRALSADEAEETLKRDWLFQAGDNPSAKRVVEEIDWARALAERIQADHPGKVDFAGELAKLTKLRGQAEGLGEFDEDLYLQVRKLKRKVMFNNPVVDFDRVLYVDMPYPAGKEWPHETRHRLGYMAVPGARLLVLDGLSPAGIPRKLMPQEPLHGSFWRPDLDYDGKRVVFCFKPHNEKAFHLYEINLDGSGLVQLTDGIYDDFDPIYLPDGEHVMFSTTRAHTYVRCMPPTNAYVLARCKRDGSEIYLISRNNEPDYLPSVMNDGRVIYTRWEYTDKPLWRAQGLWVVNPSGTQVNTVWGNQTVWPDLLKDARSIPGSRRVMFTGSAHHNWFSGSVGIIDPEKGFNFPNGLTKVTADVIWPESGNGPVDPIESPDYHASGKHTAYYSPYPLSEKDFLVSAKRKGKFLLYLMDTDGNRELIYEGTNNIFHALPVRPRRRPPEIIDRVAWPAEKDRLKPAGGLIYSTNVYQGAPPELAGKARFLRVLNIEPKTYTYWHKRPYLSTGPVVSAVQSEGVKRVVGTVPIEKDGSVAFEAPTGKALHFQLLDENYRALQTMRSFTGVMPGERRGCLGCHESHSRAPAQSKDKSIATTQTPRRITPPPWGDDTVSYLRYVRPVLDKYCGECHQGDHEGREVFDLTARPGFLFFEEPYMIMTGRPAWGKPYVKPDKPIPGLGIANMLMVEGYATTDPDAYVTPKPMTHLSYNSRLIDIASSGEHYDVKVDAMGLRKLIAWVDTMCPYRGDEEVREIPDPEFQGMEWLSITPKVKSAPRIVRPGPVK